MGFEWEDRASWSAIEEAKEVKGLGLSIWPSYLQGCQNHTPGRDSGHAYVDIDIIAQKVSRTI